MKDYQGSIAIELLEASDMADGERVQVVNVTNGEPFETYLIDDEPSRVALNGAAVRLAEPGDAVIVLSDGLYGGRAEADPTVRRLDARNRVLERRSRSWTRGPAESLFRDARSQP